jgi:hypothetical protein
MCSGRAEDVTYSGRRQEANKSEWLCPPEVVDSTNTVRDHEGPGFTSRTPLVLRGATRLIA